MAHRRAAPMLAPRRRPRSARGTPAAAPDTTGPRPRSTRRSPRRSRQAPRTLPRHQARTAARGEHLARFPRQIHRTTVVMLEGPAPPEQAVAGAVDPRGIVHVNDAGRGHRVAGRPVHAPEQRAQPGGLSCGVVVQERQMLFRGLRARPRCCRPQSRGSRPGPRRAPREIARARTPPSRRWNRCPRGWSRRRRPAGRPRADRHVSRWCRPFQLTMMTETSTG